MVHYYNVALLITSDNVPDSLNVDCEVWRTSLSMAMCLLLLMCRITFCYSYIHLFWHMRAFNWKMKWC